MIEIYIKVEREDRTLHLSHKLPLEQLMTKADREERLSKIICNLVDETLAYAEEHGT